MLKILFWNIKRNLRNVDLILNYAKIKNVDIIALCEAPLNDDITSKYFVLLKHRDNIRNDLIHCFVRKGLNAKYVRELTRSCIINIKSNELTNLCLVHLPDNLYPESAERQSVAIKQLLAEVEKEEIKNKSEKTLFLGDFNKNLCDDAINSFASFNCSYFKSCSGKMRSIYGEMKEISYNPMLNVYNDNDNEKIAKGTYYCNNNWYCYDQVIMKAGIVDNFDRKSLMIISDLGDGVELVKHNKINSDYSDHLPVYLELGGLKDE